MRREACPSELELSRALAVSAGGPSSSPELRAHVTVCAACRAVQEGLERTIRLARQLPVEVPAPARRDEVRAALLATAQAGPAPAAHGRVPPVVWAAAAAATAATVAAVWLGLGNRAGGGGAHGHASVRADSAADYAVVSGPPAETLRLRDGTLALEVEPLGPGERFRVVVGGDEIEVRGTAFELTAKADRLVGVHVTRGRVEVRPAAGERTVLGAGESWRVGGAASGTATGRAGLSATATTATATTPTSMPSPTPTTVTTAAATTIIAGPSAARAASARPVRARARAVRVATAMLAGLDAPAATRARQAQESLYDDAWDAMRAGDFQKAAVGFASVIAVSPAGPLADEGAFWRAVALARTGSSGAAIAAFRDMLDRYGTSPRRGEASAMLGWLLVDAHQWDEAARRFRAAAGNPTDAVRISARKGLDAITR